MKSLEICFATNNAHKLEEVQSILPSGINILSLKDIACFEELPENQKTIEGNALEKAAFVSGKYGINCFADDTGLEVSALGGEPGADTAHYAGPGRDAEKNMDLLLKNLEGVADRSARFKTIFAFKWEGEMYSFEGLMRGKIALEKKGETGFGYDPVFIPEGYEKTFAELGPEIKNKMSHRALASKQLAAFLSKIWK
jgi:XTP/dITP diphosphohydrolase